MSTTTPCSDRSISMRRSWWWIDVLLSPGGGGRVFWKPSSKGGEGGLGPGRGPAPRVAAWAGPAARGGEPLAGGQEQRRIERSLHGTGHIGGQVRCVGGGDQRDPDIVVRHRKADHELDPRHAAQKLVELRPLPELTDHALGGPALTHAPILS